MQIQSLIIASFCISAFMLPLAANAQEAGPVQIAFVGVAHIHTPDFVNRAKRRQDVKVKCVWDADPALAKHYADILSVPAVMDVNQIWSDPQIKGVIICSQTNQHLDLVAAAARAHKHIYAEKPLGMGAADSYAMARQIHDAGVYFQTGYFMRGEPAVRFLKEQVAKGNFGKITRIRGVNTHSGALGGWFDKEYRWMADPKESGIGGFGDLGTHSLDLMLWIMNEPVTRVTAAVSNGTARYPGCDELGEGILLFKNGTIGTLAASWDDETTDPVSLEIAGTEGHAAIINGRLYFQSKKVPGSNGRQPWTQLPEAQPHAFELFLDALTGKKVTLVDPMEAAYRCAVVEALYSGAHEMKWADVQQPPAH